MLVLSVLAAALFAAPTPESPTLLLLPNGAPEEPKFWKQVADSVQWHYAEAGSVAPGNPVDPAVKELEKLVEELRKERKGPIYLVGAGANAAVAFYAGMRAPHLFTALLAVGGTPKLAIDTDRVFAANAGLLPIAWAVTPEEKAAHSTMFQKLAVGGISVELLESANTAQAVQWLAKQKHTAWPQKIDCETGNPTLARCYWLTPTEFDPKLSNAALRTTRISADSLASLDFGGFGYRADAPGPGVVVEFLPPNYSGPLKVKDRILALSGANIADPRHYVEKMSQVTEEKPVAVTIERDKERIRLVTRYVLRQRPEVITARVQAEYVPDLKEITIVSRTVATARLQVPPQWAPVSVNWNGTTVAQPNEPGCWIVSIKNPGEARPCQ